MILSSAEAWRILESAELIYSAEAVAEAVDRVAGEVSSAVGDRHPLILSVMGGAVVFTGQILPKLHFPMDFNTIHISRYRDATRGGKLEWKLPPPGNAAGRSVLVLDDILDEGATLAAIRDALIELGAARVLSAVMFDKEIGRPKPIAADFVGLKVPNRYLFGFGMDVYGAWRNLPAIYALCS